jgi:hypothetical protein
MEHQKDRRTRSSRPRKSHQNVCLSCFEKFYNIFHVRIESVGGEVLLLLERAEHEPMVIKHAVKVILLFKTGTVEMSVKRVNTHPWLK